MNHVLRRSGLSSHESIGDANGSKIRSTGKGEGNKFKTHGVAHLRLIDDFITAIGGYDHRPRGRHVVPIIEKICSPSYHLTTIRVAEGRRRLFPPKCPIGDHFFEPRGGADADEEQLLNGNYEPKPVRRVEIPKPDGGGVRKLGIPSVFDKLIQQAVLQVLQRQWDRTFFPSQLRVSAGTVCSSSSGQGTALYH
jgi:hypothetical protein